MHAGRGQRGRELLQAVASFPVARRPEATGARRARARGRVARRAAGELREGSARARARDAGGAGTSGSAQAAPAERMREKFFFFFFFFFLNSKKKNVWGGQVVSHVAGLLRRVGCRFASGVVAATGWEPDLSEASVMISVFLSSQQSSARMPQLVAAVRLTTLPLGTTSLNTAQNGGGSGGSKASSKASTAALDKRSRSDETAGGGEDSEDLTSSLPPRPPPRAAESVAAESQPPSGEAEGRQPQQQWRPFRVLAISLGGERYLLLTSFRSFLFLARRRIAAERSSF